MHTKAISLRAISFAFAALLCPLLLASARAEAPSSVVNTTQDVSDSNDGLTSLREAIKHVLRGDVSGPVTFDPAVFAHPTTITLDSVNNPPIILGSDIEIDGSAAGVTISGGDAVTIFDVFGTGGVAPNVTLKNLTIAHGHAQLGGAIAASNLDGKSAPNLTLIGCTFSDNVADSQGGAIFNQGASISAENCTFSRNQADPLASHSGSGGGGGAIYNNGNQFDLNFCTIAFNGTGSAGGGILSTTGTVLFGNSIIGNNVAASGGPDVDGAIVDGGSNILGNDTGTSFIGNTDTRRNIDPGLVPIGLADNGGPTQTIALQANSPAIDAGGVSQSFRVSTDQRGQPRPVDNPAVGNTSGGDGSDIGAFEFAPPVIVNNFGNPANEVIDVIGMQGIAQAFTTDGRAYRLNAVNPVLALPGGGTETVELQLRANNDKNDLPGAILEMWSNVTVTGSNPQDIIRVSTGTVLSPNTQYWLVVKAVSGGQVNWIETSGTANAGVGTTGALVTTDKVTAMPTWKAAHTAGTTLLSVSANVVPPTIAVGRDSATSQVATFDATETKLSTFFAFSPQFSGGVRVASADFDGDGVADVLVGAGPGGGSQVTLFRGSDGTKLQDFAAFGNGFNGGVYVAAGDVDGDGTPDIIVGSGPGGGAQVKVFSGKTGAMLRNFDAFASTFQGGVRVAAGDLDGDGFADIIVAAGPGSGRVRVFSGKTGAILYDFLAYGSSYQGGVFVACGDVFGSGSPAIVTGTDAGGSGQVNIFSGPGLSQFETFNPSFNTNAGCRVATADLHGDGVAEIIVASGPNGETPVVQAYSAASAGAPQISFSPFPSSSTVGCFVAGAVLPQIATLPIKVKGAGSGKVTTKLLHTPLTHVGGLSTEQSSIDVRFTESFKLTATPASGSVFAGWTDQNGQIAGFDETSTFRMAPGLSLQANFDVGPFVNLAATYDGTLIFDDGSARGHITATVGTDGSVAIKLTIGTPAGVTEVDIPQDQILGNGEFQHTVAVKGIGDMLLSFQLALDPVDARFLSGTLTQVHSPGGDPNSEVSATFTALSEEFQKNDCLFAGRYTLILYRVNFAPDSFPQGNAGLQVVVAPNGKATFSGVLGDGTRLAASFRTSLDGECAFFFPLYKNQGFLAGTLNFRNAADTDIDGALTWAKPPGLKGTYPDGFFGTVTADGVKYTPVAGQRLILNPNGTGDLQLFELATNVMVAGKPVPVPEFSKDGSLTLDPTDVLHLPDFSPDVSSLKCKITRSNGTFSGSFKQHVGGRRTTTFSFTGVIVQPKGQITSQGGGTMIRGTTTGAVFIFPN